MAEAGDTIRRQLRKKLVSVLLNSIVEANRLHSLPDCYKIKLRSSGCCLVYQVIDREVVAIDKREREEAYHKVSERVLNRTS